MKPCCLQGPGIGDEGSDPLSPFSLLYVLDLFAELFDLDFDFDGGLADAGAKVVQAGGLGKDRGDLTVHFLEDEVHSFAGFVLESLEAGELVEVAAQTGSLLGDVAS